MHFKFDSNLRPNVRAKTRAEADADWPRKDDTHRTWSGQAVAAVVGRRLSEGLGVTAPVVISVFLNECPLVAPVFGYNG